jgi:hypothetical protein
MNIATMTDYFTANAITLYAAIIVLGQDAIKALNAKQLEVAMTAVDLDYKSYKGRKAIERRREVLLATHTSISNARIQALHPHAVLEQQSAC